MTLHSVSDVKAKALDVLDTVGNFVAKGGQLTGEAIGLAGKALQQRTGFESPALRRSAQITARALELAGSAVSSTFNIPARSAQSSTNFQAGTAAGFDAAFLLLATASSAIPGVNLIGAGATASYGLMRYAPGFLAQWQGRDDEQTRQGCAAGKLIMGAAAIAAFAPPVVGTLALAAAKIVSARNAHVLIKSN